MFLVLNEKNMLVACCFCFLVLVFGFRCWFCCIFVFGSKKTFNCSFEGSSLIKMCVFWLFLGGCFKSKTVGLYILVAPWGFLVKGSK